jgi:PKD repeat protein
MGCKTGKRVAGDVAAVGDPQTGFDIFDSFETGPNPSFPHWIPIGGTSLSSPLVAAMWALAGGAGSEKYPAKSLYDRRRYTPTSIKDITVGGNSWCDGDSKTHCSSFLKNHIGGGNGNPNNLTINGHRAGIVDCGYNFDGSTGTLAHDKQCYATTGYDGASGVGAPRNLTAFMPTRITVSLSGPSPVVVHTVHSYSATNFTDGIAGATAVSYKWTWGDGTSTTKTTASASHRWGHTGAFKVTLVVTDSKGQKGSTSITVHVTT